MINYKDFAITLALQAGEIMKKKFTTNMHKEWKADKSPLTKTDLEINELILREVRRNFSCHGVLSEEGSNFHDEKYVWVCDPVDGTFPFSHGYPLFTFSLALLKNGYPILGLLYDPVLNRLVRAELGKGAYLNDKPIRVASASSLQQKQKRLMIAVESGELNQVRQNLIATGCLVTTFACITYSAMLVALGKFAGAIWRGKTPWDAAAAKIIIEEAGGTCTDLTGHHQKYNGEINGLVVSNKRLHHQLIKMIRDSGQT